MRLEPLRKLRTRDALSDEDMVSVQRANLLDPVAPNPSVETLLHAFLPHKFVDHTHATAVLEPRRSARQARRSARKSTTAAWAIVPYIMPGFALAKNAADVFERDPQGRRADPRTSTASSPSARDAREAYERMIEMVTLAEERLRDEPQGGVRRGATAAADRAAAPNRADPARRVRA